MKQQIKSIAVDAASLSLATFVRNWMRSLRFEIAFTDPTVDPANARFCGPAVYVMWHEYIPFMFYLRGHCNIAMLTSRHRDAELLSRSAGLMGFDLVRGSSKKGALAALRGMIRKGGCKNLVLTPDGPRGPRRELAAGCIYMASRLEVPLIAVGLGYDRPWRNQRAWDKFAIPRPWSRACAAVGPAIHIPRKARREELDAWRLRIETILNDLTEAAETAATTGRPLENTYAAKRACQPLEIHRSIAHPPSAASQSGPPSTQVPPGPNSGSLWGMLSRLPPNSAA